MIHIPRLVTPRLDVLLRELTMREALEVASVPPTLHQASTDLLLRRIVAEAAGEHSQPGRWTVQERMMVVAHYIACTSDSAGNFDVGGGKFLDYLDTAAQTAPDAVDVGEACGDEWRARQISGDEALAMESLCRSRADWFAADMAARMFEAGKDDRPDPVRERGRYVEWLKERMGVFLAMPESDFEDMHLAYCRGHDALHHLFALNFDDEGFVVTSEKEGGLAPARFPAAAAVGRIAQLLGARTR